MAVEDAAFARIHEKLVEKKSSSRNRVLLYPKTREILDGWRNQLIEKCPGIKVTDSELSNWAISKTASPLSPRHVSEIKDAFFDDVKELEWRLKEAKAARHIAFSDDLSPQCEEPTHGE